MLKGHDDEDHEETYRARWQVLERLGESRCGKSENDGSVLHFGGWWSNDGICLKDV